MSQTDKSRLWEREVNSVGDREYKVHDGTPVRELKERPNAYGLSAGLADSLTTKRVSKELVIALVVTRDRIEYTLWKPWRDTRAASSKRYETRRDEKRYARRKGKRKG